MKLLLTLAIFQLSTNVHAWSTTGHRVVGEIAQRNLSKNTKAKLKTYIGDETLADVANWADFIKSDPHWSHANPWHYVTIKDGSNYEKSEKVKEGDVIKAINTNCETLKNPKESKQNKIEAIKFMSHFIGDIHQPLHVGGGNDRGGNDIEVEWFGKKVNLHQVWDNYLIDMQEYSYTEYASFLERNIKLNKELTKKDPMTTWVSEVMSLRESVYDIVKNKDEYKKYGEYKYNFKNIANLNLQLYRGGLRLSQMIEACLK